MANVLVALVPAKARGLVAARPGRDETPLHRFNNDMVLVDGRALQSAGWEGELDTNSYSIDYEHGHVFLGIDPTNHVIEITVFDMR